MVRLVSWNAKVTKYVTILHLGQNRLLLITHETTSRSDKSCWKAKGEHCSEHPSDLRGVHG